MSEVCGYEQMRGSIDPLDIFLQAHRYFLGQELIYSSCDGNPQKLKAHAVPAVTLGVLACEPTIAAK
jgi:hypothetical protein